MNCLARLDLILLALMLSYVCVVVVGFSCLHRVAKQTKRHRSLPDSEILAALNHRIRNLKSTAAVAPFLGLAGTCFGILTAFRGIDMERHAALVLTASEVAAALMTTAAGIVVAIAALWAHNHLCASVELLESENSAGSTKGNALKEISCAMPAFGTTGALILATLVSVFLAFNPSSTARGYVVEGASLADCSSSTIVHLHVSKAGNVTVESRAVPANELVGLLSRIYATQEEHDMCLSADSDTSFQNVADVIDAAKDLKSPDNRPESRGASIPIDVRIVSKGFSAAKNPTE